MVPMGSSGFLPQKPLSRGYDGEPIEIDPAKGVEASVDRQNRRHLGCASDGGPTKTTYLGMGMGRLTDSDRAHPEYASDGRPSTIDPLGNVKVPVDRQRTAPPGT